MGLSRNCNIPHHRLPSGPWYQYQCNIKTTIKQRIRCLHSDPLQSDARHNGSVFTNIRPPTFKETLTVIRSMPSKSSPLDKIPMRALKSCPEMFAELITHLITLSFEEGKFSEMYKCASVTPLLKKQELDADLLSNYCPVLNLHTISKIVERVFMTRLAEHVKLSPNYNRFQSAYRRGHSTETALLRLLNDVYIAANNGFRTVLVQLDLTAAFDTIDINTLLCRLRYSFGISGPVLSWISSYIVGRTQFVRVGQEQSPRTDYEYRVPQTLFLGRCYSPCTYHLSPA